MRDTPLLLPSAELNLLKTCGQLQQDIVMVPSCLLHCHGGNEHSAQNWDQA